MKLTDQQRAALLPSALGKGWSHDQARDSISKRYTFPSFPLALAFITGVLADAHRQDHHPELGNVYTNVSITFTTHDCQGLSERDLCGAEFCDALASRLL